MAMFYMYTGPALDFGWMRACAGFAELRRTAYRERLGEVEMRDLLERHPQRTRRPREATLFFVPIWEVTSFRIGECNGTTHARRMSRAATALRASPHYAARNPKGFDHFVVSTGCIEEGKRAAERLGPPLASALGHAIVGRDRAYNAFYKASAVGRCTVETPYVANNVLTQLADTAAEVSRPRRWLLSFHGSLDVCCDPGKALRTAAKALIGAANDTQVVHVVRNHVEAHTQAEQEAMYVTQARAMLDSTFCLVPAGDNEVRRAAPVVRTGCTPDSWQWQHACACTHATAVGATGEFASLLRHRRRLRACGDRESALRCLRLAPALRAALAQG